MISEKAWKKHIASLKTKKKYSKADLKKAIIDAVVSRIPKKKFGILFSGGIDSSLIAFIAKKHKAKFICYAVGLENAADIEAAKKAAKLMKINLKFKVFSLEEAARVIKKTVKIVGTDTVKVGVGSVVVAGMELAKKDKVDFLFGGLGSEEIFAGYERHVAVKDINKECWRGLKAMWQRDLVRDFAIAEKMKFKTATPFLDDDLIKAAMSVDGKKKINKKYKKVILRKIAEEMGLPKEIAWRKKQAAQYGSKFDRAIYRLARRNGFKFKKDYLNSL